jgi:methylenetetrahydrofolate reductase (NADPH)
MAKYMKNRVPGMDVPDDVVERIAGVPKENQAEEGHKDLHREHMQRLKEVPGVAGLPCHGHRVGGKGAGNC